MISACVSLSVLDARRDNQVIFYECSTAPGVFVDSFYGRIEKGADPRVFPLIVESWSRALVPACVVARNSTFGE